MNECFANPRRSLGPRAFPWLVGLLAGAAGCYPSSVDNISDYNTVTTVYDTSFNRAGGFQALSTYSIPGATQANPGGCVIIDLADGGPFFQADSGVNPALPSTICSTVVNELNGLGYQLIDPATAPGQAEPSFVVTIGGLNQSYTAWVTYPWYGYWGPYYPYYPWGGWGYYYPWGPTYTYSYNIGTLVITMVKPTAGASLPDGGTIDAVWAGALNGVVTSYNISPPVVANGIEQAFNQSPYLGRPQ